MKKAIEIKVIENKKTVKAFTPSEPILGLTTDK